MAAFKCDTCGFGSFKTEQSFRAHLLTKKHIMRQESTRQDLFQCKTCNKWYCGRSGISHHNKTCSFKNLNPDKTIDVKANTTTVEEIVHEMKQAFEKERQEMKLAFEESMKEQINKILVKHAGTTNTNNNTNHIETQNINIININAFGNENTDYIDDHVILDCIGRVYKSIPSLLEKIHFDPKHPENHNIKITNKKLPYASVMGNNKKWKTVDRKDAIDTMVTNSYNMLDEKYSENKDKLPISKQQHFRGFQNKFESEDKEVLKQIKTEVDMMILNGCNNI